MTPLNNSFTVIGMAVSTIFSEVNSLLSSPFFLFHIEAASAIFKISLLIFFVRQMSNRRSIQSSWIYLLIAIIGSLAEDVAWLASLSRYSYFPTVDYRIVLFTIRMAWGFNIILHQFLALFIESFIKKETKPTFIQYSFRVLSGVLFLYQVALSFIYIHGGRTPFEFVVQHYISIYVLLILLPFSLFRVFMNLQHVYIPKILKRQVMILLQCFIVPFWVSNIIQMFPFAPLNEGVQTTASLSIIACSTIFLLLALFYSIKKIVGLRFLNVHDHVHSPEGFNFTDDFKSTLEGLGSATNMNEIKLLAQRFFKQALNTSTGTIKIYIRNVSSGLYSDHIRIPLEKTETFVENFIDSRESDSASFHTEALQFLKKNKILIYDEVEYDDFYKSDEARTLLISFLNEIQADIFLPIFEKDTVIAYIIIERHARGKSLYSDAERDEMLVFASYLSHVINILQHRNLKELLKQRKDVMEELYTKHQEINQYKESIRSFLRNNEQNTGIIFYKNNKFTFGNEHAHKIIGINPNKQEGHPLSKALKYVAKQTHIYKTSQTQFSKDETGRRLVLCGIPHTENNSILITVHYPEISDVIKQQIDMIKDPSDWDYLLYLETTHSGKLVNQLIPGNGENLLNFKINLLKLALSKKTLVLDMPEDDLVPTVELLHHISLRETLCTLDLQSQSKKSDVAIKLFGINPLFGQNSAQPLLEKLNKKGTLLIKNIHYLDLESQNNLAQFIKYGFYTVYKSDQRVQSDVRIITSTNKDLNILVEQGTFSQSLFSELRTTSLTMPPLLTLPDSEIDDLIEGFTKQALTSTEFDNLLLLTDKERDRFTTQRPISLKELKDKVQQLLINKSKKNEVYHETYFDPAYNVSDPQLVEAARLGKQALKDPKLLGMLWNKFKNQNKIALFLGVNRSSVNRRCKEYGLL